MKYYDQDGKLIEGDTLQWAELSEDPNYRIIGQCKTLYGEKLSTIWLGMDHGWGGGPPLIFETMLFAPRDRDLALRGIRQFAGSAKLSEEDQAKLDASSAHIVKYYPHDQLQRRYSTKADALADYRRLRLQCLIPPRLRRLILFKLGGDDTWS